MKNFSSYFLLIFSFICYSTISFSQEEGLKVIVKKQQNKIQQIENNLKSLIGKLENRDVNKSILDQLNNI